MTDLRESYRRACTDFATAVRTVGDDQWELPTPCADWDVRALVNHVVGEDRWTAPLLQGQTIEEVGDRFDGDLLGDDPAAAAGAAAAEALAAAGEPDVLERVVHLSYGDAPAAAYLQELFADHLVHRWDLAVAIGGDTKLDDDLVATCAAWCAERGEAWREAGVVGPRPPVPEGADAQTRMLADFGRASSWPA